ncbi:MAG TPA: tetratricopeptide repeat protein [Candidatus Acidoferrales bacterium]|nr:tetratricopeptide repeat protein [Candidatus Acidoferrales bacterium]
MEFSLGASNTRRLMLVAAVALSGLLIEQAVQIWRANALIGAQDANSITSGARVVPGDAEAWDRLGRFQQWNFADPDAAAAVRDYQKAVQELPISPYYWVDLAGAYEQVGNISSARNAFERAEAAYPTSAEVEWHYGNFLLRQGDVTEGLTQIQRSVRGDPLLIPLAISRVWLSTHDVHLLLDQVLPPEPGAYLSALDYFQSIHDPDSGLVVWNKLLSLGQPFPLARTFLFQNELIREGRADDERKVWQQAVAAAGFHDEHEPASSLIWDGQFKEPFANGGLGWHWNGPLGASIDFDSGRTSDDGRSVRLDFNGGNNTGLDAPYQYVPVEPSSSYQFRAYLKTSRISTESGMRFSIIDPDHSGEVNVETENLTGTNLWTPANADINTAPDTHFLLVRLYRSPSRLFENKLSGTAWIGDVSLIPTQPTDQKTTR